MNKNKIIVDFMRVDNVLIAKIINTPKCLIGKDPIITSKEAYDLKSCRCPELRRYSLYLDGTDEEVIRTVAYAHNSIETAQEAMKKFISLIDEYNSKVEVAGPSKTKWDIEECKGGYDEEM